MLISFVINTILGVFDGLMSIMPRAGANYGFGTAYTAIDQTQLFKHFAWANNYFPITELVNALLILLGMFLVMTTIRVILWIRELL